MTNLNNNDDILIETTKSYSTGHVDGQDYDSVGGAVGNVSSNNSVEKVYWDTETSSKDSSAGSSNDKGLSTTEMQGEPASDNLDGFDFDDVWETVEGDYPVLQSIDTQVQLDNR